jgi:hypothetical protein
MSLIFGVKKGHRIKWWLKKEIKIDRVGWIKLIKMKKGKELEIVLALVG